MVFFPMELLRYKINISKDEMINRLNNNVESKNFLNWTYFGKPFFGEVYENRFKIIRHNEIIRNSFRPVIIGNIIENGAENTLEILMRPHLVVLIIMSIFLVIVAINAILFSIILMLIFYPIMVLFFKFESKQAKKFLDKLFEGNINTTEEETDIIKIITYAIKDENIA